MRQIFDESFLQQIEQLTLEVKENVAGLFGGNHKSKKYGSSCEFADYRDYIEGDDVTKIDWNLYGKFEKMYIKLFLDERQMQTKIYIDTSKSMSFYKKDETALRLAVAFAYISILQMDKVSIYALRGKIAEPIIENLVGKDAFLNQIWKINDIKFEGDSQISEAIVRSTVGFGDGRSIILSDFLTDNNFTDAIDYLRGKRRDVLAIQVLAEEELRPQFRGKMILRDSENDQYVFKDNIGRDILGAYQKALNFVTRRISDFCLSREADYLQISTSDSLSKFFFKEMAQRGIIR